MTTKTKAEFAVRHHLVAHSGDIRTVCGLDTRKPEGWPYLLAKHVRAHVEGHRQHGRPFLVCVACGGKP